MDNPDILKKKIFILLDRQDVVVYNNHGAADGWEVARYGKSKICGKST